MLRLSFINSPVKILTKRGRGGRKGCPATEQKKTSAYIFTPATPLVAPKTVNFAPNRNPTYMSETPFPNLLSFYHCSQSLYECSGARGYADVKTKFSGFDRFPCSINVRTGASGAPLCAPTLRSARIYIKYIYLALLSRSSLRKKGRRCSRILQLIRAWAQLTNTIFLDFFYRPLNL